MTKTIITASNVAIVHGRGKNTFTAISKANLTLAQGEAIGLVGENGCGKTTLIKTLAGLKIPTSGEIRLHHKKSKIIFGLLSTEGAIYKDISVKKQLELAFKIANSPSEERYDFAIGTLGIKPLINKRGDELSFGQKQRVRIAYLG